MGTFPNAFFFYSVLFLTEEKSVHSKLPLSQMIGSTVTLLWALKAVGRHTMSVLLTVFFHSNYLM